MKEIVIATKNIGKVKEFITLFTQYGLHVKSLLDIHDTLPDVKETGKTFQENARLKAETIAYSLKTTVLADDSGLVVDALDGRPGVYSARYSGEPKDDDRNNKKLLNELKDHEHRTARFVCVLACAIPNQKTIFVRGTIEGEIAHHLAGENGFGYDPLFIPMGYNQTMAQLHQDVKNKMSHRYRALQQLERIFLNNGLIGDTVETSFNRK